jgi:hypothetical protein
MGMAVKPRIGLLMRRLRHDNPKLGVAALETLAANRVEAMHISKQKPGRDEHRPGRKPANW